MIRLFRKRWEKIQRADLRFDTLVRLVRAIDPTYRMTWNQIDWWENEWFNDYLSRFGELHGMNTHRRWQLYQLMKLVRSVPGDTAECGVYRGATSFLICQRNLESEHSGKTHHVFDSFQGLSNPDSTDGEHWRGGDLDAPLGLVRQNLSQFDNVRYYPGWIPDEFPRVEECRFSFAHIDVDLRQPTVDSVEFFYPRLNPGGILLCDDYGVLTCPGATSGINAFLEDKPEEFVGLSAGGGFLIKSS